MAAPMSYTSELAIALILVLALVSIMVGVMATILYQRISSKKDVAMAKFQLVPDKTANQFKLMFGGGIVMQAGLGVYIVGAVREQSQFLLLGRAAFALYALVMAMIMAQWWRRL